ncbi:MAG TPA: hypothetical protein VI876_06035 [Dehalococcoidia bacterium]|nr:hypothetical protein [Dehalococcoidia bacterium]
MQTSVRDFKQGVVELGRVLYLTLAGLEGFLFLGTGFLSILLGLHLMPSDPGADGRPPDYGPWHATPEDIALGIGFCVLGLPATLGLLAILNAGFPARRQVIAGSGLGMVALAGFSVIWVVKGWSV